MTKNGAKLTWDKPEDDGGTAITAYVVEKMDMSTGRWVPVGRTQKPEMEVKGLQEGHEYKFRVKAVNDEGESEPLETDGTVVAKNPFGNTNENHLTAIRVPCDHYTAMVNNNYCRYPD